MLEEAKWSVIFYRDAESTSPVRVFLQSLDQEAQDIIGWAVVQPRLRTWLAPPADVTGG